MSLRRFILTALLSAAARAGQTPTRPPSRLGDALPLKLFATTPDMLFEAATEPVVTRSYQPGEALTVKPGEVLLRRQVQATASGARFDRDIHYRSGMPLSNDYLLKADTAYPLLAVPRAPALRALQLPARKDGVDEYLVLNAEGQLCERVMTYKQQREFLSYSAGSYRAEPAQAAQIEGATPEAGRSRGQTIALSSIDAIAFELISRPSVDGVMGEAIKQSFDRQKRQLDFAGYTLAVDSVSNDGVTFKVLAEPGP